MIVFGSGLASAMERFDREELGKDEDVDVNRDGWDWDWDDTVSPSPCWYELKDVDDCVCECNDIAGVG